MIEKCANANALNWCNGKITESEYEIKEEKIINELKKLFIDERLPVGFFVNSDPRGFALKISDEVQFPDNLQRDVGGYGILAPEL